MSSHPSTPPNPPDSPPVQGPELIPFWRMKRLWKPDLRPSGRVEYADAGVEWELVNLTREEYVEEMQRQQHERPEPQDPPAWGSETPRPETPWPETPRPPAVPSENEWIGEMSDDEKVRDGGDEDGHAKRETDYVRAPTPFSGFDDADTAVQQTLEGDAGTEQAVSPPLALDATDDNQRTPAINATKIAGSSPSNSPGNDGEERGGKGEHKQRRVSAPVEGVRKSSRKRTKTRRMVEEGG